MAFKVHDVTRYNYSFGSDAGGASAMQLWHGEREIVRIDFVPDGSPLAPPVVASDLGHATVRFHASALPALVDMLRCEKPVRVTINGESHGSVFIHTGVETVGKADD